MAVLQAVGDRSAWLCLSQVICSYTAGARPATAPWMTTKPDESWAPCSKQASKTARGGHAMLVRLHHCDHAVHVMLTGW